MAEIGCVFADGFDDLNTTALAYRWDIADGTIISPGRLGGKCLQPGGIAHTGPLCDPTTTFNVGIAYIGNKVGSIVVEVGEAVVFGGRYLVVITDDGRVAIVRRAIPDVTVAVSDEAMIHSERWNYFSIAQRGSVITVWVNGDLAVSGDIALESDPEDVSFEVNEVVCYGIGGGFFASVDDLVVRNDFNVPMDSHVRSNMPSGDGAYLEWDISPASPTTHYDKVAEIPPDGEDTYVEATVPTKDDTWEYEDVDSERTILVVQWCHLARASDAGAPAAKFTIYDPDSTTLERLDGDITAPAAGLGTFLDEYAPDGSPWYFLHRREVDPFTGDPWDTALFNGYEYGAAKVL